MDPTRYNVTIRKIEIDGETLFEARIKELPDVIEFGDSVQDAYELAIDTIEATADHFMEVNSKMPAPSTPVDDFSGRVTLRIPRSLHRALSEGADEEHVSLNQYLVGLLSYFSGYNQCKRTITNEGWVTSLETRARSAKGSHVIKTEEKRVHLELVANNEAGYSGC